MQIITRAKLFTRGFVAMLPGLVALLGCFQLTAHAEWKVDFSRRQQLSRQQDLRMPASSTEMPQVVESSSAAEVPAVDPTPAPAAPGFFESLFETQELAQEVVLLNTDKGFVPSNLRLKKGQAYQIHVVNVNEKEKNVSFVLDSFSEHHATYYGKVKSFMIKPQKEGVYRFVSPETSAQGKIVVYPAGGPDNRLPASE